jgi:hypothetical protein
MTLTPQANRTRYDRPFKARIASLDGSFSFPCLMEDISAGGVRLWIDISAPRVDLTEFDLLLSASGQVRRRCRLLWRSDSNIGAYFIPHDGKSRPDATVAGSPERHGKTAHQVEGPDRYSAESARLADEAHPRARGLH